MGDAENESKTRLKRTRTGCLKCRVRRRKCDERKPSCQRCVGGGFECQYGTKLSFLQKNAKTSSGPRDAKQSYAKLRFVVPETATKPGTHAHRNEFALSEAEKTESSSTEGDTIVAAHKIQQTNPPELPAQPPSPAIISHSIDTYVTSPRAPSHSLQDSVDFNLVISTSNAAYETALDGLLALGNDHYVSRSAPAVAQTGTNGGLLGQIPQNVQLEVRDKPREDVFPNCLHMPQDRAVELLRHYRYNIAPWLDINDPDQTFGLFVPRIAMNSVSVLDSVLSLSLETLGDRTQLDLNEQPLLLDTSTSRIDILCCVLVFTFTTLRRQFATQPTSWSSPSKSTGYEAINSTALQLHHPTVALAMSWMILRLGVSVGLMSGSSVPIPSIVSREVSSPMGMLSREPHRCGREPVLLCAEVLNYCFGGDIQTDPDTIRLPAAHRWKAFSEALQKWYSNRPTDFKPMLEAEDGEQLFPLVLFTNGSAILANQLYHTSMLLLLQNRPRTLPKEHGRNIHLSPLWHAQRICGISLNNDTRTNWDFGLLASFYFAAKRMTYEPQQHAILRGIDRIGSLTGWNVLSLSAQLMHEWQPD
ncbi:transcriptional regulatory protein pro-1 [Fusarium napiforme]|uniref:Transcriptional regulatory protein pro-1 n=1 Tax=Fusarium napiforme TaxID=42672 RepID=A0A8H5MSA0_9HYPO|nr:transcriptional regulatory protein pro-1 [Fusarium napiforme]